jgi:hypothetical protein
MSANDGHTPVERTELPPLDDLFQTFKNLASDDDMLLFARWYESLWRVAPTWQAKVVLPAPPSPQIKRTTLPCPTSRSRSSSITTGNMRWAEGLVAASSKCGNRRFSIRTDVFYCPRGI